MKKLYLAMILAVVMLFGATALAEEIVLPDPGYYFGREYKDDVIEFDTYPKAEFDAYTTLLMDDYGLEITHESKGEYGEYYIMQMPGVDDSRVIVTCYAPSSNSNGYGLKFSFGDSYVLKDLDAYEHRADNATGEIAWDDGRMIADPGDFLGYEIELLEIAKGNNAGGGFIKYVYESIPIDDILALVDAVNASPYFERNSGGSGSLNDEFFWLLCHDYTGPDEELASLCESGRAERYGRESDLSIYIFDPDLPESEFAIYEYPGFTVNSEEPVKPTTDPNPDEWRERCIFCNGGSCKTCGGSGYVYQWIPGEDEQRRINCTSCMNGRCTFCDGDGWR